MNCDLYKLGFNSYRQKTKQVVFRSLLLKMSSLGNMARLTGPGRVSGWSYVSRSISHVTHDRIRCGPIFKSDHLAHQSGQKLQEQIVSHFGIPTIVVIKKRAASLKAGLVAWSLTLKRTGRLVNQRRPD